MSTRRSHNPLRLWAVLAAFSVFAFLLIFRLGEREMTLDETITVGHTETARSVRDAFHPMGYYWLLYYWRRTLGDSDGVLRAFSVVWALAAAVLVWLLARALLRPGEDVLALWLFVLSPFALLYLRMARYFSLTIAVALAVAYFALLARREGRLVHYLGLGLAAAGLLLTNYVPCLLLPLVYLWLLPRAWGRSRERWRWLLAAAMPLAVVAARFSWLLFSVRSVAGITAGVSAPTVHTVVLKLLLPFYAALVGETTDFWRLSLTGPVVLAGVALWVTGIRETARRREPARWLLLLPWPLTVIGVTMVLSTVAAAEPWPRVTSLSLFALPFFLMTLAVGCCRAIGKQQGGTSASVSRVGVGGTLLVLLLGAQVYGVYNYETRRQFLNPGYSVPWREVYGVYNYETRRQFLNPGYSVPWREVNRMVQTKGKPGEVAVAWWDAAAGRYWSGPVQFVDLVDETLTWRPLPPEVANFPETGVGVWVIARDRGSGLAVSLTERLLSRLSARAGPPVVYHLMPRSPTERHWRQRLGGRPVQESYLTLYHFRREDSH